MIPFDLLNSTSGVSHYYNLTPNNNGRILIIGDIHGCLATFIALLKQIDLKKDDQLFLLGDYVNKGPNSIGVIDKILDLMHDGFLIYPLRGNHESFVSEDLEKNDQLIFYPNGQPHRWDKLKYSKSIYKHFFTNLPYYYRINDLVIVHAGLNLEAENPFTDYDAMIWIWDFYSVKDLGFKVIHGHSITILDFIEASIQNNENSINLDNGCYKKGKWGKGNLICYNFTANKLLVQENIDTMS
ncbi:metallophosphoesterase family protein [Flammeovirga kamogawensis]|uniref:Serine/threonine protein phosphatase n=1 Tax=Flammeovirga kamogawensis TaxID=373891 RepID=A0ABX8H1F6_9BACT|nr:metallophosphoesterase family protein [Flammeovirga kamogawensis]MBB6463773.1 serine/threonine protein phosphatase 1 [Flammeovirga kamogawensis]QWG09715.1 serine/threonine protein phosphatase [Flammeovirga kamogawensis]